MYHKYFTTLFIIVFTTTLQRFNCQQEINGKTKLNAKIENLYLTINARQQYLELSWNNFDDLTNYIVVTSDFPISSFEQKVYADDLTITGVYDDDVTSTTTTDTYDAENSTTTVTAITEPPEVIWQYSFNNGDEMVMKEVLCSIKPIYDSGWTKTDIKYDYALMYMVDVTTSCYGFYVYIINENGTILAEHCLKVFPTWMNDIKDNIKHFKMRQLFIPGTHDSASYKRGFNPLINDNLVRKYSLTQDDDIRGQLMHGARYIDLRVGYYRAATPVFWANHGISRQHPLTDILQQIRAFVMETNEIVIVDIQEFPIGFGRTFDVHRMLIHLIQNEIGDVMADPSIAWNGTLNDIWKQGKTLILSYDLEYAVSKYSHLLWTSVEQKWGNVQQIEDLKLHLIRSHRTSIINYTNRPVADMAELTPDPWGVITDRYGGLRKMADGVNRHLTKWYFEELGTTANIVAMDFIRGTNIVEAAIYWNLKRAV